MADELQNPKLNEEDDVIEEEEEGLSELRSPVATHVEAEVNCSLKMEVSDELKEQVGVSHQDVLASKMSVDAQTQNREQVGGSSHEVVASKSGMDDQTQTQTQSSCCPTFSYELSPTSVTQSVLSDPSSNGVKKTPSPIPKGESTPEVDQRNSSDLKTISALVVKTPSADGYNWRKYGQKQVKSPKGSRSYYRCTYFDCYSKKIECSDHVGGVVEIIYRGRHNHEPPRKVNRTKESKLARPAESVVGNGVMSHPELLTYSKEPTPEVLIKSDPSTSSKEPMQEASKVPERKRQNSSDTNGNAEMKTEEDRAVAPEPKRRLKKSNSSCQGSTFKEGKKSKLVVHAAGDVGISSDGYRWRKYGQKMVKGNPHPRNYYRCTSAGCPVRKHIERAVDNTSGLVITYKGVHDHDMPVPKKRHGPPSPNLVAAAAPASMSNLQLVKSDAPENHTPSTQWSVETEGELAGQALDLGGEKAMESARTLLSIGFEIKPC